MFKYLIYICALLVSVHCHGEFTVLHHPSSIVFKGHDHIKESLLEEVYSASIGFSTEQDSNWQGMYLLDPFNLAEAVVTVAVDGVSNLDLVKGHHFGLRTDIDESSVYTELQRRIEERNPEGSNHLIRIDLSDGLEAIRSDDVFHNIKNIKVKKGKYNFLKVGIAEDRDFLQELTFLNAIADEVEDGAVKRDNTPDVFWFKVLSLHALSDLHGENSSSTKEAKQLLAVAINRINDAFNEVYDGHVIVTVISSDASHTRRTRSVDGASPRAEIFDDLNLAKVYSNDYPVIFNIILWFGVVMVFVLLAISIFIADMDPGRDSIIYRMTSTRMKKDN